MVPSREDIQRRVGCFETIGRFNAAMTTDFSNDLNLRGYLVS